MKKLLFCIVLMLVGMTAWAQDWNDPGSNAYPNSTPVYVKVNYNGGICQKAIVAAFIDGECRAVSYGAETIVGSEALHLLRVWGDLADDKDKDITFKVAYAETIFAMNQTIPFTGETYQPIPLELNIERPTGVSLTNPLDIVAKLTYEYDLTNDIKFSYEGYDESGAPIEYTPKGECVIETPLTYKWDYAGSEEYYTIKDKTLIATKATGDEPAHYLSLTIPELGISARTRVNISEPVVPVERITCSLPEVTMSIKDNLYNLQELTSAITVLPEDASNKNYSFELTDPVFNQGSFSAGGTYTVNIVSESDPNVYTTIQVTVTVPVESISLTSPSGEFSAVVGDNIYDLIVPYVEVYPQDATNPDFYLEVPADASDAITDNVAYMPGSYTLYIVSDENPEIMTEVTVNVIAITAPEEITMYIGQTYGIVLDGQITVAPQGTYSIQPATEADREGFNNEEAIKSGEYTLVAICNENDRARAEIKVTVLAPVEITYPVSLTASKLKDTELALTLVGGDEFDPELVEVRLEKFDGVIEPVTCKPANNTGLKWNLRANLVGVHALSVLYDGKTMFNNEDGNSLTVSVPVEIPFNNDGWDWIYYPAALELVEEATGSYWEWMNQDADNRIIEIRSQTDLLYNDANFGLFGTIETLSSADGMYKVKAQYENAEDAVFVGGQMEIWWDNYSSKDIVKGYNWIGYPNEWNMTVANLNSLPRTMATDGDVIIGKDGFAEYSVSEGGWVGSNGFYFQTGKGYLYYRNSEDRMSSGSLFDFTPTSEEQILQQSAALAAQQTSEESVWQYDARQFADNMAMVAVLPQLEYPADYTIGAFVGNECRGKGSVVNGEKMMISVAGKAGETVTFRLHNELTGEFFDLNESVTYAQRVGSLKSPVALTSDAIATGISEIIVTDDAVEGIFDLNGRRVEKMNAGGIYIVKTLQNGKIVTKKVVKK